MQNGPSERDGEMDITKITVQSQINTGQVQ